MVNWQWSLQSFCACWLKSFFFVCFYFGICSFAFFRKAVLTMHTSYGRNNVTKEHDDLELKTMKRIYTYRVYVYSVTAYMEFLVDIMFRCHNNQILAAWWGYCGYHKSFLQTHELGWISFSCVHMYIYVSKYWNIRPDFSTTCTGKHLYSRHHRLVTIAT